MDDDIGKGLAGILEELLNSWKRRVLVKCGVAMVAVAAGAYIAGVFTPRKATVEDYTGEVAGLQAKVEELGGRLSEAEAEKERIGSGYRTKEREAERLAGEKSRVEEDYRNLEQQLNALTAEKGRLEGEKRQLQQNYTAEQAKNSEYERRLREKDGEINRINTELATLTQEYNKIKNELDEAKRAITNPGPLEKPGASKPANPNPQPPKPPESSSPKPAAEIPHLAELVAAHTTFREEIKNISKREDSDPGQKQLYTAAKSLDSINYSLEEALAFIATIENAPSYNKNEGYFISRLLNRFLAEGREITLNIKNHYTGIGAQMSGGKLIVTGHSVEHETAEGVNAVGSLMRNGVIIVKGNAKQIGSYMQGGQIIVEGNVDTVGGYSWEWFMKGKIEVRGSCKSALVWDDAVLITGSIDSDLHIRGDAKVTVKGNINRVSQYDGGTLTVEGNCGSITIKEPGSILERWPRNIKLRVNGNLGWFSGEYHGKELRLNAYAGRSYETDAVNWLRAVQSFVKNPSCKIFYKDAQVAGPK